MTWELGASSAPFGVLWTQGDMDAQFREGFGAARS